MYSENLDSEIFANLQQQQEILLWRYATETVSFKKKMIGARMLLSKLKGSLMASFYSASQVNDIRNRNLANAVMTARSLSPWQTVKRTFAMERTIRKWEQAKAANDFTIVQDELQSLVDSMRIEARKKASMMGVDEPYDALLRSRTQGLSTAYFDWLTERLPTFCYIVRKQARSLQAPAYPQAIFEDKTLDQDKLERMVLQTIGYDLDQGRVAQALHPLCMGMHDDVRIGVRASKDFTTTILTAGHEGGHGTYRQNLPVLHNRLDCGLAGVGARPCIWYAPLGIRTDSPSISMGCQKSRSARCRSSSTSVNVWATPKGILARSARSTHSLTLSVPMMLPANS